MPVAEPHKELRFTRSGQAAGFWVAAAVCLAAALVMTACSFYRDVNPRLPHPAWGVLPLVLAWLSARTALRCTRHAYLILTPLGIEVFPFFRPASGMQLIPWAQVAGAEIDGRRLTLHYNAEKTAGLHLSLGPLAATKRPLLAAAIGGRFPATGA